MSGAESLLCEVSPLLESRLALRAAEELFFGDSLLYVHHSNEGPTTSAKVIEQQATPGKAKEQKKAKKDKGDKGQQKEQQKEKKQEHPKEHAEAPPSKQKDELQAAIQDAKDTLKNALQLSSGATSKLEPMPDLHAVVSDVSELKAKYAKLREEIAELRALIKACCSPASGARAVAKSAVVDEPKEEKKTPSAPPKESADDGDFDLFGSSDEEVDEEKERIKQERLKAYAEKKAKKPASVAKSSVILDIKPWDDETDMEAMESLVRAIEKDGLVWGGGKLIPLAYGIKKLQIICVIEDEKVSVDDLIDSIVDGIPDHVQSVDIAAFNKI